MYRKASALLLALLLCASCTGSSDESAGTGASQVGASPLSAAEKIFGGAWYEDGKSVLRRLGGGYMLAGLTHSLGAGNSDGWLVATDAAGAFLWQKTYGGAGMDAASAVIQTADGGCLLCGVTDSAGAGGLDAWLVKTDAAGNIQWETTLGGALDDSGWAVTELAGGGYAMAGETASQGSGKKDIWLVRTDAAGAVVWERVYGGLYNDSGYALRQTSTGDLVIAGVLSTADNDAGMDLFLARVDLAGTQAWAKTFGGAAMDRGNAVLECANGDFAAAGVTASLGAGSEDAYLVRVLANGTLVFEAALGYAGVDRAAALVETGAGNFLLAGYTSSFGAKGQAYMALTGPGGNLLWGAHHGGGAGIDTANAAVAAPGGEFVLLGRSASYSATLNSDAWLFKTAADGSLSAF
jgi:hypothetical protein